MVLGADKSGDGGPVRKHVWLKYAHGALMVYSWASMLSTGWYMMRAAHRFPFKPGSTADSLLGRCYGRDLRTPDAPAWLEDLQCGAGAYCAESSGPSGGANWFNRLSP
jgi:hypothetical protein